MRSIVAVVATAAAVGVGSGFAAHSLFASQATSAALALPELHGQATWLAGERRAPPFILRDAVTGTSTSLAAMRGRVTLVAFLDSRCKALCPIIGRQIGAVQRALAPAASPHVLVVSVDPAGDSAASVRAVLRRWNVPPGWHWLSGTHAELARVWRAYGIEVRPRTKDIVHGAAVYLVDRRGDERAGYLAPLLPNFVALDIRRVEAEAL